VSGESTYATRSIQRQSALANAFDAAIQELGLTDRAGPTVEVIAKRIIWLAHILPKSEQRGRVHPCRASQKPLDWKTGRMRRRELLGLLFFVAPPDLNICHFHNFEK